MAEPGRRPRAPRLDPATRRGLIVEAAERLLAEHDPLLVTFDQVAEAAQVSRALVHTYLGDRRGLIDAVQVRTIGRLDAWVGHGLGRADSPRTAWRAIVHGVLAFVESEPEAWSVLGATGGLDHPALHDVRRRWVAALLDHEPTEPVDQHPDLDTSLPVDGGVAAAAAIAGLLLGAGPWANQGVDPDVVARALDPLR